MKHLLSSQFTAVASSPDRRDALGSGHLERDWSLPPMCFRPWLKTRLIGVHALGLPLSGITVELHLCTTS